MQKMAKLFKTRPDTYITLTHQNPSTPVSPEKGLPRAESNPVLDLLEHLEGRVEEYYFTAEWLIKLQEGLLSRVIEYALGLDQHAPPLKLIPIAENENFTLKYEDPETERQYQFFRVEEYRIRMLLWDQTIRMYDEVGYLLPHNIYPGNPENLDAVYEAYPGRAESLASRYIECVMYLKQHLHHCQKNIREVLHIMFINRHSVSSPVPMEARSNLWPSHSKDSKSPFREKLYGLIRRKGWHDSVNPGLWMSIGRDSMRVEQEARRDIMSADLFCC